MAGDDRTEQATPRRREKAREKGRVARSRELSGALVTLAGVLVLLWVSPAQLERWRGVACSVLSSPAMVLSAG